MGWKLSAAGALLALAAGPFAAVADAPFAEGGLGTLPPFWAGFRQGFLPLLTFASDAVVLSVWQFVVTAAMFMTVVGAWGVARHTRRISHWTGRSVRTSLFLVACHGLGVAVESLNLLASSTSGSVGFALYMPTLFLVPAATAVAGVIGLRTGALGRLPGLGLVAAPLFFMGAMLSFQQFPGGTAPGLLLPWAIASVAAARPS